MPWKNITPMEEIIRFVMLAQSDRFTVTVVVANGDLAIADSLRELKNQFPERLFLTLEWSVILNP